MFRTSLNLSFYFLLVVLDRGTKGEVEIKTRLTPGTNGNLSRKLPKEAPKQDYFYSPVSLPPSKIVVAWIFYNSNLQNSADLATLLCLC